MELLNDLLTLIGEMDDAQLGTLLKSARALFFYAQLAPPGTPEMVPHSECLGRVLEMFGTAVKGSTVEGWLAARARIEDMRKTAPSLLDQAKDLYAEGLRAGMDLGRRGGQ